MHGGDLIASVLQAQGTRFLFTLCGGHISPILVGCKQRGIRVIDTRHEATAVFAADAVARLTGRPGVAAVTAGPGLTNTLTAVKNAQIAQSPVVLLGGAAATALKGRGALQDIDQMALLRPHVKWAAAARRVADLPALLEQAFGEAARGVPGPVFLECPIDLLYDQTLVRQLYGAGSGGRGLAARVTRLYLRQHVRRLFAGGHKARIGEEIIPPLPEPDGATIDEVAKRVSRADRPVLLVGSQALVAAPMASEIAAAVERLGMPVYLSGMARGLLGRTHQLQLRHQRRTALKEADLVILAGVPCDFRLDYGRQIGRRACYIAANRSAADLRLNRRPTIGVLGDAGLFLCRLAERLPRRERWSSWQAQLRARDQAREDEIARQARAPASYINPIQLCREIEAAIDGSAILIGDGGDFVATASYIVRPRGPLAWLDPGAFGTLGVGAGFALGAKLVHPDAEVWALFGDGALGYSLAELDTFARHGIPIIAVVGNDAGWTQIAREQIEMLHDDIGTTLAHTDYHRVAEGFGAAGLHVDDPEVVPETLQQARELAAMGKPVLVNAVLGKTDFRKGSISI
ncbi:MAG TPA: thiamine pyrophosphate-binding protein [Roseiflexaceae bacterium]|nr:thiamine pyrophosphate-binding protein [Roseiflexaceae bacterium]